MSQQQLQTEAKQKKIAKHQQNLVNFSTSHQTKHNDQFSYHCLTTSTLLKAFTMS